MTCWQDWENEADEAREQTRKTRPPQTTPLTWLMVAHAVVVWALVILVLWLTRTPR